MHDRLTLSRLPNRSGSQRDDRTRQRTNHHTGVWTVIMGIFNGLLAGAGNSQNISALTAPQGGAFSPVSPGDLSHKRSIPIVHHQRPFDGEEAEVLAVIANQREHLAQSSKMGYEALQRIEAADQTIHESYRGYQLKVSEVELAKRKSDAKYLEGLQNQRPQYAELGSRLMSAESRANQRQREIKARVDQLLKGVL